jgi:hypothetical protein
MGSMKKMEGERLCTRCTAVLLNLRSRFSHFFVLTRPAYKSDGSLLHSSVYHYTSYSYTHNTSTLPLFTLHHRYSSLVDHLSPTVLRADTKTTFTNMKTAAATTALQDQERRMAALKMSTMTTDAESVEKEKLVTRYDATGSVLPVCTVFCTAASLSTSTHTPFTPPLHSSPQPAKFPRCL